MTHLACPKARTHSSIIFATRNSKDLTRTGPLHNSLRLVPIAVLWRGPAQVQRAENTRVLLLQLQ